MEAGGGQGDPVPETLLPGEALCGVPRRVVTSSNAYQRISVNPRHFCKEEGMQFTEHSASRIRQLKQNVRKGEKDSWYLASKHSWSIDCAKLSAQSVSSAKNKRYWT